MDIRSWKLDVSHFIFAMILLASISACASPAPDVNAVRTSAAQTVVAEFARTPVVTRVAPTLAPQPTGLPRPTAPANPFANLSTQQSTCLRIAWGSDVFQQIITLARPATKDEEKAYERCGVALNQLGATLPSATRDQTWVATSADGLNWDTPTLLADQASVPEVMHTSKGMVWAYWVDFSQFTGMHQEKIGVAKSADGKTWEKLGTVKFAGLGNITPVDPDVIELPDGRRRMYFFNIAKETRENPIHSAISADGINYTLEPGTRFQQTGIFDPDVIRMKDGRYRMYLNSDGSVISATSNDGLSFSADPGTRVQVRGSIPGSIVLADGTIRLYTCNRGISVYKSNDGLSFALEKESVISGTLARVVCDPAITATPTGFVMVFKTNVGQ
ncbi:MAG: hypothetical protein HZC40_20275 [Chloroflexi bacterium]|nr:hypothetical protein [Chloroflexota bacterium]